MRDNLYFQWLEHAGAGISAGGPASQVLLIVVCALVVEFLLRRALRKLQLRPGAAENSWDSAVLAALRRPASLLIWVLGLGFAMDVVQAELRAEIFTAVAPLRRAGVIVAIAWFLLGLTRRMLPVLGGLDFATRDAVRRLLRASIFITAALVMMQTFGFNIAGVLAFGGIGGIAIGFAARDLLANFFGGLMLYLDRPFKVGDWVRSPDREIEGTVEDIGWRLTRIRAFDMRPVYVPNNIFSGMAIVNPSRMSHRQIYQTIHLRHQDAGKVAVIVDDVKEMLERHDAIESEKQTVVVNLDGFTPYSLKFFIYAYTGTTQWAAYHAVKQDVLLRVHGIISKHGAELAGANMYLPGE
ncbi:MAG: mechanosensitive ion channel family protein [Gammaproteobacteria bacterium]|nr:mechanosensitive ion channel family protein [Gammaproteobacteria bacterium]